MKKRILSIITALALAMALLPVTTVPASAATTYKAATQDQFEAAMKAAQDGDVIELTGTFVMGPASGNDSLVIDKSVTIQGGGLTLWHAGILLAADVTFKDITLGLTPNVRNALMANGHTLTLENVQRDPTTRYIHLFCGGQTGKTQGDLAAAKQGPHGQIIIKGNTNLGLANIYAGSISTDGTDNVFTKPATVTIDPSVKGQPIEHIYASGALETYTSEDDWFDFEHEIAPPTPSAPHFKVSGDVTFNLCQSAVKQVDGNTGTQGKYAKVNYNGKDYLNDGLILTDIGGLNVVSGNLLPAAGSRFATANAALGIAETAILGLQNMGQQITVGDFTGGGSLALGPSQTLTAIGAVTGTTTIGIGGIFNGHSQELPILGAAYIDAAGSTENSFTLAAPASRPDLKLVRDPNGTWNAAADKKTTVVNDFRLDSAVAEANAVPSLPFHDVAVLESSSAIVFSNIELIISVNGVKAAMVEDNLYATDALNLFVTYDSNNDTAPEALEILSTDDTLPPAGTYFIEVTVPAANSGTGQPITRTATLTVKPADAGTAAIPEPHAQTGLIYTGREQVGVSLNDAYILSSGNASATDAGNYTAAVTPAAGFTWEDGSTETKTISWSIDKANNPDRPTGLGAAAPSAFGAGDGKITGTTTAMEYAADETFISSQSCTGAEITGLAAGDYYVRAKETSNYKAGEAVMVTVPQGPLTIQSIKISDSASCKTSYQVGEPLDVAGLTLAVTMNDGSTYSVPVSARMVTGFDSSAADPSQTLTITYAGKTVTYTISIADNTGADPTVVTGVTVNKSAVTLAAGKSERLTATVYPDTATNKNVTWTSKNTSVATVDANGTVTAVSAGTAVITVTTEDGNKTASCTVTVSPNGGSASGGGGGGGGGGGSAGGGSDSSAGSGTTTETTRNPDGSTTVVETKQDGTVTTTKTTQNGVKVETVSKPGTDTSARITLPSSVQTFTVTLPVKVSPGTVALNAKTGEIVKLSAPTEAGMVVKLDASAELILKDRSKAFADISGHWAKSAIDFAVAHALFNGTSDTTFAPDESMTRGMVAVVLYNFEGCPDPITKNNFTDAAPGTWYADAINWIADEDIADGYSNGSFGADDPITRQQLITFLYRYAKAMGYRTEGAADLSAFPDEAGISTYAVEPMRWAVGNGLIAGTAGGILAPGDSATRAQTASILKQFILNLTK